MQEVTTESYFASPDTTKWNPLESITKLQGKRESSNVA